MARLSDKLSLVQTKALQLRDSYEAFLQDRQATEASILQLAQLLETRKCTAVTILPHQKSGEGSLGATAAALIPLPPAANDRVRSVSFAADEAVQECMYQVPSDRWPLHGHLASPEGPESEIAFDSPSATKLGGRKITLQTKSAYLDCILIEPMLKRLEPDDFVTSGLAICLHGQDSGDDPALEWAQVLKHTKLLDAGISVLVHEVPLNVVADVEALVEAALQQLDVVRCLLIGKALGAPMAAAMAEADSRLVETCSLAGVLFVTPPPGDVPEACSRLQVPSFILGGRGDMCTRDWIEAMREQDTMPFAWQMASASGTDLARIVRKDKEAATKIRLFSIAVLLMAEFSNADDPSWNDSSQLPGHVVRLCEELPDYLAEELIGTNESGCQGQGLAAVATLRCRDVGAPCLAVELHEILNFWVRRGLVQQATATE